MNEAFIRAISADEIAVGGMKAVKLKGSEVAICNCNGEYYAIERRCGHMNAPLDMGTLDGIYLTCPMHCAQFNVTTGEALSGPIPSDMGTEPPSPILGKYLQNIGMLMKDINTESIRTYATKLEDGWILISI